VEFNLLYRWHSLVPDRFFFNGTTVPATETGFAHSYLTNVGVAALAESAARQRAWEVGLFNTAPFLLQVELGAVKQSRDHLIASYNDYREVYGFPRVTRFEQITGDPQKVETLRRLYKDPDNIEFFVGLFAEDVGAKSAVPPLIGRMVALDAFSQALTNPLMSEYVYNEATFTQEGLREMAATETLQDVINRNLAPGQRPISVSMEYREQPLHA
jgi:prostaglandin-endoperoxide synthase 2